nr:MAG TPA: hypothetical protein [Caudoviricetes sp.]
MYLLIYLRSISDIPPDHTDFYISPNVPLCFLFACFALYIHLLLTNIGKYYL